MKKLCIIFSFIVASILLYSQDHMIQGVVHTFEKIPLTGVEIKVKSTKQSVYTDTLGKFIAFCAPEDKLKVMAKGFFSQSVKITENAKLVAVNLQLKPGEKQREYAIGYGYVSEGSKTNAVTGLNTNNATFSKYSDIYALIRSELPGAQITNGEIIFRGDKSFFGSSAALIVVDGVIWDAESLSTLSPIQVKSIDAIKDGGSAIYGDRGANGVILIETLKGGDEIR